MPSSPKTTVHPLSPNQFGTVSVEDANDESSSSEDISLSSSSASSEESGEGVSDFFAPFPTYLRSWGNCFTERDPVHPYSHLYTKSRPNHFSSRRSLSLDATSSIPGANDVDKDGYPLSIPPDLVIRARRWKTDGETTPPRSLRMLFRNISKKNAMNIDSSSVQSRLVKAAKKLTVPYYTFTISPLEDENIFTARNFEEMRTLHHQNIILNVFDSFNLPTPNFDQRLINFCRVTAFLREKTTYATLPSIIRSLPSSVILITTPINPSANLHHQLIPKFNLQFRSPQEAASWHLASHLPHKNQDRTQHIPAHLQYHVNIERCSECKIWDFPRCKNGHEDKNIECLVCNPCLNQPQKNKFFLPNPPGDSSCPSCSLAGLAQNHPEIHATCPTKLIILQFYRHALVNTILHGHHYKFTCNGSTPTLLPDLPISPPIPVTNSLPLSSYVQPRLIQSNLDSFFDIKSQNPRNQFQKSPSLVISPPGTKGIRIATWNSQGLGKFDKFGKLSPKNKHGLVQTIINKHKLHFLAIQETGCERLAFKLPYHVGTGSQNFEHKKDKQLGLLNLAHKQFVSHPIQDLSSNNSPEVATTLLHFPACKVVVFNVYNQGNTDLAIRFTRLILVASDTSGQESYTKYAQLRRFDG